MKLGDDSWGNNHKKANSAFNENTLFARILYEMIKCFIVNLRILMIVVNYNSFTLVKFEQNSLIKIKQQYKYIKLGFARGGCIGLYSNKYFKIQNSRNSVHMR